MTPELEMMKAMASLFKKKAAVMSALGGGMEKKGNNEHFNYKFVTASDIKRTVSALFMSHGLSLQMSGVQTDNLVMMVEVKDYQTKSTRMKEVPILRIQFSISLCDVDTGAVEQSFWFGEAGATDDKAASKAATSALKYYLISNLLIADKDEDKHDTDRDRQRKQRPTDTPPPPAPVNTTAASPTAPVASSKPQPPAWWPVLSEYKPFMEASDFDAMRDALSEGVKKGTLNISSDTEARTHIERTHGLFIDTDAMRAAAKEAS